MKVLEGRDNPCYDKKTNTHCQKRCAGCGTTCKEWKNYEMKRNKDYVSRKTKLSVSDIYEFERSKKIKEFMKRFRGGSR